MKSSHWLVMSASLLVMAACGVVVWSDASRAVAQTGTSKSKPKVGSSKSKSADSKELDSRAEKVFEGFVTDTIKLSEDYEKAGKFDEAQDLLRTIGKLKPEMPGLKEKIQKLNEAVFETNDYDIDLDVGDSWKRMVHVSKGKPVRVETPGNYKLSLIGPTDANGLPTKDPRTDMAAGVRCGALMGIVMPLTIPARQRVQQGAEEAVVIKVADATTRKSESRLKSVRVRSSLPARTASCCSTSTFRPVTRAPAS